ncbi:MAG: phosphonate ABC transporter ATP-binding protein [Azoarcus sp.]|jgi:phosphonate transport system ATP-binding protein|nr:phosphonate ABC transporter ATP-binding protein [Azoarcus sp.]
MHANVVHIAELNKSFGVKQVLFDLSLQVREGEMVALIGSSGSGKSTLLRHLSGLVSGDGARQTGQETASPRVGLAEMMPCASPHSPPHFAPSSSFFSRPFPSSAAAIPSYTGTASRVEVLGRSIQCGGRLSRNIRQHRSGIGYIFQQFNLVGRMSVIGNVLLGSLGRIPRWRGVCGLFSAAERRQAFEALERVGMAKYAWRRASTLSGGQQQRVAIARALTQRARIILADEPVASLDPESARKVMDLLAEINAQDKTTVLVSLHQVEYARHYCPRTIALKDGRIHYDGPTHALSDMRLAGIYGAEIAAIDRPRHGDVDDTFDDISVECRTEMAYEVLRAAASF